MRVLVLVVVLVLVLVVTGGKQSQLLALAWLRLEFDKKQQVMRNLMSLPIKSAHFQLFYNSPATCSSQTQVS